MLWFIFSFVAAICTSLTTIFAKIGVKNVNSDFATFYRTGVVIVFSALLCLITGGFGSIVSFTAENYVFLVLSGLATGFSWLCYYKALKDGEVKKVAPIDKSSFVLTGVLFVIFFFDETTKNGNPLTIVMLVVSSALMLTGTLLMVDDHEETEENKNKKWIIYAVLSAVFAALTSLFIKLGLRGVNSNLGTLLRSLVVFAFAGAITGGKKEFAGVKNAGARTFVFLTLSGVATGGAWLCEYAALADAAANPVVVGAVGKFSILLTMTFCAVFLKEKFTKRSLAGLIILTAGIALITIFGL